MDDLALYESIERLVEGFLEARGVEFVELLLSGNPRRRMLRIYVDRPGRITIDECAVLSRGLEDLLDTHDPIDGSYTLEVSSPGLNRALKSERDYQRAVGQDVRLVVEGRGVLTGTLVSCQGAELVLTIDGEVDRISRAEVRKANLHFDF